MKQIWLETSGHEIQTVLGRPSSPHRRTLREAKIRTLLIRRSFAFFETAETFHYPLTLNLDLTFFPDGTVTQLGVASQEFNHHVITPFFASSLSNKVESTDILDLSPSFSVTGNSGQQSSQHYTLFDTRGRKYDCSIAAQSNALTSFSEGCIDTPKVIP